MKKILKGLVRFIIIMIILIIIIVGALVVFRIPITKYIIERSGSALAGAKVEVDQLYMKPFKLHVSWGRLQVTDKSDTWKNLFETGSTEFMLAFKPVLAGKILIENIQIDSIKFNTERSTDGRLPKKIVTRDKKENILIAALKKNLEREKQQIPIFRPGLLKTKIDVDSLFQILDFQTPAKADSLKDFVESRYDFWDSKLKDKDYEQDISAIRSEVKNINLEDMNNLAAIERNFTALKNVYDTSDNLYKDFLQIKGELEGDLASLRTLKEEIPVWIKSDYNNAVSLAKLPDVSVQNVALMLFGDKITSGIIQLLEYLENSREIAAQKSSEKVKGPEKQPHLPKFWIQNAQISLQTNNKMILSGRVTDISTDQDKAGKPLVINLKGAMAKLGRINLGATFDYRELKSRENINLMINEVPIRNFELANFDLLPTRLEKGTAMLITNINLTEELIYANLDFAASDLEFDYNSLPEMNEQLVRIARSISEAIDEVNFQAEVSQNKDTFKFKLNSNLDNIIAAQLKNVISGEINRAKAELQAKVQKELDKYRADLDVFIDQKSALIQDKFDQVNQQIDDQKSQITAKQKEIDDRVEAEKQKIKNQAEDKLKEEAEKLLEQLKF